MTPYAVKKLKRLKQARHDRSLAHHGLQLQPSRIRPPRRHEPAPEQLTLILDEYDAKIAAALARMDELML